MNEYLIQNTNLISLLEFVFGHLIWSNLFQNHLVCIHVYHLWKENIFISYTYWSYIFLWLYSKVPNKWAGRLCSVFSLKQYCYNRPSKLRAFQTGPDHQNFPDRSQRTRTWAFRKNMWWNVAKNKFWLYSMLMWGFFLSLCYWVFDFLIIRD